MATPNCVNDSVLEHLIVASKGTGGNCKFFGQQRPAFYIWVVDLQLVNPLLSK